MKDTIEQYIQAVLQREPTEGEADNWTTLINSDALTLDQVRESIINSAEASSEVYPIIQAYQAIYGRVPDADGLEYWVGVYRDNLDLDDAATPNINEAMVAVLDAFVDPDQTPEFADRYGTNPTASQFVAASYANVLNRTPDQEGLAFWTARFNEVLAEQDGNVLEARAIILEQFVSSTEYASSAATAIDNFLDEAAKGEDGAYDGTLWSKDENAPSGDEGQTFTLTTGTDNLIGTSDNDIFRGQVGDTTEGSITTIQAGDFIDGGDGFDTFVFNMESNEYESVAVPEITNIEQIVFRNFGGDEYDFGGTAADGRSAGAEFFDGVEEVVFRGGNADVNISGVPQLLDVALENTSEDDFEVEYQEGVLAGDSDTQVVRLDNVGLGESDMSALDVDGYVSGSGTNDLIEEFDLRSNGSANFLDLNETSAMESLLISGDADLYLDLADESALTSVDASAHTGDLTIGTRIDVDNDFTYTGSQGADEVQIDSDGATNTITVDTSTGDDNLTVDVQSLLGATLATLNGGEGQDNLTLDDFTSPAQIENADFSNVTGFEQLTLDFPSTVLGTETLDLSGTDFTSLVVDGPITNATNFTVVGSADFNSITTEQVISGGTYTYEGFETLELNTNADVTADLVGEELTAATLNVGEAVDVNIGSLNADLLETLTVNLGDDGDLNGPTAGSAAALGTITVTGGEESTADFTFGGDEESLSTIDLSGMAGGAGTVANDGTVLNFAGDVENDLSILIGEGDLEYNGDDIGTGTTTDPQGDDQEVFTFTGDDIGLIDIEGFTSGVGGNGDRIDFSQFAAVTGLGDLEITFDGNDTTIVADGDQFDGTIKVLNTDLSTDAFNFIF